LDRQTRQSEIVGVDALLGAVRNQAASLRERYKTDPVGLAAKFGLKFPKKPLQVMQELGKYDPEVHGPITPGLRDLIEDVCLGHIESAAAVANRGGGKSQGVSFIEFFLVFLKDYDALNLGGSELQADQVYQYIVGYIDSDKQWQDMVDGDALASKTTTKVGAWIRVLTASQKSVRSPHAGGVKKGGRIAGGLLVIDEEAEAAPEIVAAALPTINTAQPSVNVRASTFHNAEGSFAEVMDNAVEMGYKLYKWDIFDVAKKCDCTGDGCQSEESCFREDHYETYMDPDTGEPTERLLHKAYCGGRAMYADGWIPMSEIIKLWKRGKRNHANWEVEAMGSRPSSKGFVIRDPFKWEQNTVDKTGTEVYIPGWPVTICVDWGTVACGVEVWQEQPGDRHALIHAEQVEEAGLSQIVGILLGLRVNYAADFKEIAADIGGGGNYLNPKLRDEHRLPVRDVNFGTEKESAVAAWNIYNEANSLIMPKEFTTFHEQRKTWKRDQGQRIQKGNDHLMDAGICYFSQFVERLGLNNVRVAPRAVSTSPTQLGAGKVAGVAAIAGARVAVIRTLGSKRKR